MPFRSTEDVTRKTVIKTVPDVYIKYSDHLVIFPSKKIDVKLDKVLYYKGNWVVTSR